MRRPPDASSRQAGGRRSFKGGGRMRCPITTPTLTSPMMLVSRTGGGCLTVMPSRAGCAGSEIEPSSGPDACAGWDGDCGGGHGGVLKAGAPARTLGRVSDLMAGKRHVRSALTGPVLLPDDGSRVPEPLALQAPPRTPGAAGSRPRGSATSCSLGCADRGRVHPWRTLARRPGIWAVGGVG
jgi:hypothetical protein